MEGNLQFFQCVAFTARPIKFAINSFSTNNTFPRKLKQRLLALLFCDGQIPSFKFFHVSSERRHLWTALTALYVTTTRHIPIDCILFKAANCSYPRRMSICISSSIPIAKIQRWCLLGVARTSSRITFSTACDAERWSRGNRQRSRCL